MNRREKGELALRILGVALVVSTLMNLGQIWFCLHPLVQPGAAEADLSSILKGLGFLVWPAILGILMVFFLFRPLSRLLFPAVEEAPGSADADALHVGVVVIAIWMLHELILVPFFFLSNHETEVTLCLLALIAALVYVLAYPRHLSSFLLKCAHGTKEHNKDSADRLIVGFMLVAFLLLMKNAVMFVSWARYIVSDPHEPVLRAMMRQEIVANTLGIVASMWLLVFAAKLATWLRGEQETNSAPASARAEWTRREVFEIALALAGVYIFFGCLSHLVCSPYFPWEGMSVIGAMLHLLVLPTLVAAGAFFALGWASPRLASRFYPEKMPVCGSNSGELVAFEVALTVAGLFFGIHHLTWAIWRSAAHMPGTAAVQLGPDQLRPLLSGLWCFVALSVKGDLAWLLCGARRAAPAASGVQLTRALWFWLVLLGVWTTVGGLPQGILWTTETICGGSHAGTFPLKVVMGVALVLGARPLARLLSFGRLLPSIWPRAAG